MDNEIKMEEFDSTEIKVEEIKKSDRSEDWDVVTELESETYSPPYISVPKMHDFGEETVSISYGINIESALQDKPGIFSRCDQESERDKKVEGKKLEKSFPYNQQQQDEKGKIEMEEGMQVKRQYEQENERVRIEMSEAMQDKSQYEQENKRVRRERKEPMQNKSQYEQENERVGREMEEAMQDKSQYEQKIKRIEKEIEEVRQVKRQYEQENERLKRVIEKTIQDKRQIWRWAESIRNEGHDSSSSDNEEN